MKKLMIGAAIAGLGLAMTGCCIPQGPYASPAFAGIVVDNKTPGAYGVDNGVKPAKIGTATSKGIVLFTADLIVGTDQKLIRNLFEILGLVFGNIELFHHGLDEGNGIT